MNNVMRKSSRQRRRDAIRSESHKEFIPVVTTGKETQRKGLRKYGKIGRYSGTAGGFYVNKSE